MKWLTPVLSACELSAALVFASSNDGLAAHFTYWKV